MAANALWLPPPSLSALRNKPQQFFPSVKRSVSCSVPLPSSSHSLSPLVIFSPQPSASDPSSSSSSLEWRRRKARVSSASAVVNEEAVVTEGINEGAYVDSENDDVSDEKEPKKEGRPCEVYVCNLPRSCDSTQLHDMFKPFGSVLSAEICRIAETGESRGCGYITMGSINSAKNAIAALDGSDIDGREMRVRFSAEMNPGRRNPETMNSSPQKVRFYESPHKLYIGNLARSVQPEDLWNQFRRFGTVVSVRILHDHKKGNNRIYAFLSFLSESERNAALSLNGTDLQGRTIVVREDAIDTNLRSLLSLASYSTMLVNYEMLAIQVRFIWSLCIAAIRFWHGDLNSEDSVA
ncbi:28 kDa ribonucleoprotein, chloroplastic [Senna tora]|uniref:28 kDa ribonucleoprotein, chloroplastic n=1 Tax=Senna tora TaxID=362788 RepID=A0A835CHZ3_9FABA|nr:28 kDa ribonucleoprotein, chloroplastic [Senna tora]